MKKTLFILMIFIVYSASTRAAYAPLKLYQMIYESDRIAGGYIEKTDSHFFYFRDTLVKQRPLLKIQRFTNWTCASRYSRYQVGQRAILFLNKENDHYTVMSGGNEGELAVRAGTVRLGNWYFSFPDNWSDGSGKMIRDSLAKYPFISGIDFSLMVTISVNDLVKSISMLKQSYNTAEQERLTCSEWISRNICSAGSLFNSSGFAGFVFKDLCADKLKRFDFDYDQFGNRIDKAACNHDCP